MDIDAEFQRIVDELTRRRFLTGAAFSASLLGLAACGAPGRSSDLSSTSAQSGTVHFSYRDISADVPRNPQRVAIIEGRGDLDFALLAGYPIIACGPGVFSSAAPKLPGDQYAGMLPTNVTPLGLTGTGEINYEKLALLEPDLIVIRANAYQGEYFGSNSRLRAIAPLLPVQVNDSDFRTEATDQLTILNRTKTLKTWLARYQEKIADGKAQIGSAMKGKKVAMITSQAIDKGNIVLWTRQLGTQVAADLGWDVMFLDPESRAGAIQMSTENLGKLAAADLIFHQTTEPNQAFDVPTWRILPAVKAGHAFVYPTAYNNGLLITATAVADFLIKSATQAVGDS